MSGSPRAGRALLAVATALGLAANPATAHALGAGPARVAEPFPSYADPQQGQNEIDVYARYTADSSATYGYASWRPSGEHLGACDRAPDGKFIRAEFKYTGYETFVRDPDGYGGRCADLNLDLPEGKAIYLRVCVQGLGCSRWYKRYA